MNNIIFKTLLLKGEAGNDIQSVEKTATNGLVDTYTITLTDGTTHNFNVTNGRAITSIEKTSSVGYVDTYTITFNDGTTTTFEVETASITVDSSFSTTSTNALENKTITDKFATVDSNISNVTTKATTNETNINKIDTNIIPATSNEATTTASQSYADGKFLTLDGILRQVTTPISAGDTISNANSQATTLTDILTARQYKFDQRIGNIGFHFESITVRQVNTVDSYKVYTEEEVEELFDTTTNTGLNTAMFVANGDGGALSTHITGTTHTNDGWFVTFASPVPDSQLMRLNILLVHLYS